MSLAPAVDPLICGIEGRQAEPNEWCPIPGCVSKAQENHHLWARSYLRNQPQNWVQLPSMSVCQNTMKVCVAHHRKLTGEVGGHGGWIKLEHGDVFIYYEAEEEFVQPRWEGDDKVYTGRSSWKAVGPLSPQPRIIGTDGSKKNAVVSKAKAHLHLNPGETCDQCGYKRPEKREALPKRRSVTWTVNVPADAEIGADVLDEWVDQYAALLGFDDAKRGVTRYHVLTVVLAWAMQNKGTLIEDLTEARMR